MSKNNIVVLDPKEAFVVKNDRVRFSVEGPEWIVDKALPFDNKLYVTSDLGKRKAIARITDILSIKRDIDFPLESDHTLYYSDDFNNDDVED